MDIIIILVVLVVLALLYTVHLWRNTNEKLTYMLDSLDNDDVNFRFREKVFFDIFFIIPPLNNIHEQLGLFGLFLKNINPLIFGYFLI